MPAAHAFPNLGRLFGKHWLLWANKLKSLRQFVVQMLNTEPIPYLPLWEELEATKPPPTFYTSVSEMDYTEFAEKVFEADPKFVRDTVESMYGGTALILKKIHGEYPTCHHAWRNIS